MTSPAKITVPVEAQVSASYNVDTDVIATAVQHAVAATEPAKVGQYGQAFLVPAGFQLMVKDDRDLSDDLYPQRREGDFPFVGVASLAGYVTRYKTGDTLGYIVDVNGRGVAPLIGDTTIATYVLDDLPVDSTSFRGHRALLVLRPTAAARRWGAALRTGKLAQAQLLDLVVEGIREIATPPGAELRDLIADLHAVRATSAKSVIRTGGGLAVELADNVTLHAGPGNLVTVPEKVTLVLTPFAGIDQQIVVDVLIKPAVADDGKVTFTLSAPDLDEKLAETVATIANDLEQATGIRPYWIP